MELIIASSSETGRQYGGLPPEEFWLKDPYDPKEHFDTPVDSRGLVKPYELVEQACSFIDSSYVWPKNESRHHLYYYAWYYRYVQASTRGKVRALAFREQPDNSIIVPRQLHSVIHKVSHRPRMPHPRIMEQRNDAWTIARALFMAAERTALHEQRWEAWSESCTGQEGVRVDDEYLREKSARLLGGLTQHFVELADIPQEHWPFAPEIGEAIARGRVEAVLEDPIQRRIVLDKKKQMVHFARSFHERPETRVEAA